MADRSYLLRPVIKDLVASVWCAQNVCLGRPASHHLQSPTTLKPLCWRGCTGALVHSLTGLSWQTGNCLLQEWVILYPVYLNIQMILVTADICLKVRRNPKWAMPSGHFQTFYLALLWANKMVKSVKQKYVAVVVQLLSHIHSMDCSMGLCPSLSSQKASQTPSPLSQWCLITHLIFCPSSCNSIFPSIRVFLMKSLLFPSVARSIGSSFK